MKYKNLFYFLTFNIFFALINSKKTKNTPDSLQLKQLISKTFSSNINSTITSIQLGSNAPCEDKFSQYEINLSNQKGLFLSIFDGHGGSRLSEFANLVLYPYFIEEYQKINLIEINFDKKIIYTFKNAYSRIEEEFKLYSLYNYEKTKDKKFLRSGSCALTILIINNKIYTAILGDSKARLFSKNNIDEIYNYQKLTKVFNARKKNEQKKLIEKWPNDPNIIKCKSKKSCYVKGNLQPTTALGDYRLKNYLFKYPELINKDDFDKNDNKKLNKWEGPYINYIPDIKIFDLKKDDKYIIMGSDGLWDYLDSKKISKMIPEIINDNNKIFENNDLKKVSEKIAYGLMWKVVELSATKHKKKYNDVLDMEQGKKLRSIHDDITIIVCDLSKFRY